jgi:hypothetical protein
MRLRFSHFAYSLSSGKVTDLAAMHKLYFFQHLKCCELIRPRIMQVLTAFSVCNLYGFVTSWVHLQFGSQQFRFFSQVLHPSI